MPFDSGAFDAQMIQPPMHPDMTLPEFELVIQANAPMKLIKLFFENELNHFNARPTFLEYAYDNMHVDSFYKSIRLGNNQDTDDRISAIELQFDQDCTLQNKVSAVILPSHYLDIPGVAQQIEGWGGIAIPYYIPETFRPSEVYGSIINRLNDYYRDKGML